MNELQRLTAYLSGQKKPMTILQIAEKANFNANSLRRILGGLDWYKRNGAWLSKGAPKLRRSEVRMKNTTCYEYSLA